MGKIVKYCAICEESFSEKFSFCPNCSAQLTTYEMNPVVKEAKLETSISSSEESYNITFVENRSGKTRQTLLLGAFFLVTGGFSLALVMSIYNSDAYVAALDENSISTVYIGNDKPTEIDEPKLPEDKDDDEGGGGGGGGRKDKDPVSKGDLPPQFKEKPLLTPSKEDISVTNPSIAIKRSTKGPNDIIPEKQSSTNGSPDSKYDVTSDGFSESNSGMGRNGSGGIGENGKDGVGRDGTGGIGISPGDKIGNKIGPGNENPKNKERVIDEVPPEIKIVTVAMKILSKPRAIYTDAARRNQIAGTVTLRVTFLAGGQIGNIVAIGGLPDGLTEQAIIAARNIQFEPAKRNGVPQTVTKQVQYTFTLY